MTHRPHVKQKVNMIMVLYGDEHLPYLVIADDHAQNADVCPLEEHEQCLRRVVEYA